GSGRDVEMAHGTILLAQPFSGRNPQARRSAGPRSTQVVRRGVPHRTRIDPRGDIAVYPRLRNVFIYPNGETGDTRECKTIIVSDKCLESNPEEIIKVDLGL